MEIQPNCKFVGKRASTNETWGLTNELKIPLAIYLYEELRKLASGTVRTRGGELDLGSPLQEGSPPKAAANMIGDQAR